jgi:predicted negative regulator of RcsB-dependent stress response
MIHVLAWIEIHRSRLLAGLAGLIALFGVVYLWRHFQSEREARANTALLELRAHPNQPDSAPKPSDFLKVAEEHASTSVAPRARLMAAGAFFAENKYSEAQAEFERVLGQTGSGTLAAQAAFGVAVSLDAQDKVDQAAAKYQEVISRFPNDSVAGQARLALARLQDARKQPEAALRLYDELLRDKEGGAFSQLAAQAREEITRRNPQLAATNAPAVPLK